MLGKRLLSASVTLMMLVMQMQVGLLPAVNAASWELSLSQAGVTVISGSGSNGECLTPSNAYTIQSVRILPDGKTEVKIDLGSVMSKTIQPSSYSSDVNRWKDSTYHFMVSSGPNPGVDKGNGWNYDEIASGKATYDGPIGTFVLPQLPTTYSHKNTSNEWVTDASIYLVMYPQAAYTTYYQGSGVCSGFEKAMYIPTTKTYSFINGSGTPMQLTFSPIDTSDTEMTADLTAPAGESVMVNGTSVSQGASTTVPISGDINTLSGVGAVDPTFYRPVYNRFDSCDTPNIFNTFWKADGRIGVEMYPTSYRQSNGNTAYHYQDKYRYQYVRYIGSSGALSDWEPTTGSYDSHSGVITHTLTAPEGTVSIDFMTGSSFTSSTYYANAYRTYYCSQIESVRSTTLPERPANLASGPIVKEYQFTDKSGADIYLRAQTVPGNDGALQIFVINSGGQTLTVDGQDIAEGDNFTFANVGADDLITVAVPSESGFNYSFIKQKAGEVLAGDYQAPISVARTATDTTVTFKKTAYSNAGTTEYKARYFTHYRYTSPVDGVDTTSDWIVLNFGTDFAQNTTDAQVAYHLAGVPADATKVEFTVAPSVRAVEQYGDEPATTKTWNQAANIETILLTPVATDIADPIVFQVSISGENNGYITDANATASILAWDDVGVTQCFAGLASSTLEALPACTNFAFNFSPAEGPQTLYVQAQDAMGKVSDVVEKSVNIDLNNPVVASMEAGGPIATMDWTSSPVSIDLSCTDSASGCQDVTYSQYQNMPANCNVTSFGYTDPFDISTHSYLCVKARDNAGHVATYGPLEIKIDIAAPTITNAVVVADDTNTSAQFDTASQAWYTNDTTPVLSIDVGDNRSGIDESTVSMTVDGTIYTTSNGLNIANGTASLILPTALAEGEYMVTFAASDLAGNPAPAAQMSLVVDTTVPQTPLPENFTFTTEESSGGVTFTLPSPEDSVGVDHMELSLTQNGLSFPITEDYIPLTDGMSIVDGVLIIGRDTNGNFPTSITLTGLPPLLSDGTTQAEYVASLAIVDLAGNRSTVDSDPILYDTAAPTATVGAQPDTVQGTGTVDDPFLVGDDHTLPISIVVTEASNNSDGTPTVPVTISTDTPGVTISPDTPATCESLDAMGQCVLNVDLTLDDGFSGQIDLTITDGAGNQSTVTIYAQQSSTPPSIPDPVADVVMTPDSNAVYSGTEYRFALTNIAGATNLEGVLSYTDINGALQSATSTQDVASGEATFTFNLADIAEGTSDLSLLLTNEYGNSTAPLAYSTTRDTTAPVVNGFTYAWEDTGPANNDAQLRLIWSSLDDASGPIILEYEVAQDGTNFDATQTADVTGLTEYAVTGLNDTAKVRTRFRDSGVTDIDGNADNNITPDNILGQQDVIFGITPVNNQRGYDLGYIPAQGVDISDFQSMDVTLTTPVTPDQSTTLNSGDFNQDGATIFTEDPARMGTHTVDATLDSISKGIVTLQKIFEIPDNIPPEGNLQLQTAYVENGGQLYVSQVNTLDLTYNIDTINEDSLPVTAVITVNGAQVNSTDLSNGAVQLISIPSTVDGTYVVEAQFTDGANNTSTNTLTIVRDSTLALQSVRLLDSGNNEITATDTAGDLYTKISSGLQLEVVALGDTDTYTYFINDVEVTNATPIATPPTGTQGVIIPLDDLTDNALNTLNLRVEDSAGNPGTDTVLVRVDNQGPSITGAISFPSTVGDNPVVLSGVSVADFSPVRYRVDYTDGVTPSIENPYNNSIALNEGQNDFTLTFLDALGNEAQVNSGAAFSVFVDSIAPTATVTLATNRTKETSVNLSIANIVEADSSVDYQVTFNGVTVVAQGTIDSANYANTDVTLDLTNLTDASHDVAVRLVDGFANPRTYNLTLVQDMTAPNVEFVGTSTVNNGDGIGWALNITDDLSALGDITGRIVNTTTGEEFIIANDSWDVSGTTATHVYALTGSDVRPGNTYVLYVTAQDELGNGAGEEQSADPFQMPSTAIDNGNPLNDGPTINPTDIPGNNLTVTVTNNADISFTVNNVPKGDQIVLSYILDLWNNANPGNEIAKLPIGQYDIIVTDDQGNTMTYPHEVTPYYTDAAGDLNGDGYNGGLTDHKIFENAKDGGVYDMNDTDIVSVVSSIDTVITNNIDTQYADFLAH